MQLSAPHSPTNPPHGPSHYGAQFWGGGMEPPAPAKMALHAPFLLKFKRCQGVPSGPQWFGGWPWGRGHPIVANTMRGHHEGRGHPQGALAPGIFAPIHHLHFWLKFNRCAQVCGVAVAPPCAPHWALWGTMGANMGLGGHAMAMGPTWAPGGLQLGGAWHPAPGKNLKI